MLDPLTLDQLRVLVAVVDEGSFSAAARKLRRVQSAVSTAMANLEDQLALALWDRDHRTATLTREGEAVLGAARRVLAEVDALRKVAADLTMGVEALVSLCIDAVFPTEALVELCRGFAKAFPQVDLRVDVQTMATVAERVRSGAATIGVAAPRATGANLERRALAAIRMIPVAGARHPLAARRGRIPTRVLAEHTQIVLSERTESGAFAAGESRGSPDQAVLATRTWRVHDLATKHRMLLAGLGWGNLPAHLVRADLHKGRLVRLRPEAWADDEHTLHLAAIYRRDATLGPAHRWVLEQLAVECAAVTAAASAKKRPW